MLTSFKNKNFYLLTGLLIFFLFQFSDLNISNRSLINYDDLGLIKPMLELTFNQYLTEWLPDRNKHAYPIKDLSYFLDHWLTEKSHLSFFWLNQTILIAIIFIISFKIWIQLGFRNHWIPTILFFIACIHPLNIEASQWIMIRKHILATLFILWGTFIVLKHQENHRKSMTYWFKISTLYILSLLSFPTGILWIFWAIWKNRQSVQKNARLALGLSIFTSTTIALFLKLTMTGEADYNSTLNQMLAGKSIERSLFFLWHSIGRGFFNFILPFQLAPFYDEQSIFNFLGNLLLAGFIYLLFKRVMTKNTQSVEKVRDLSLLVVIVLAPSSLVFLGFGDFVWADRYSFTIHFFLLGLLGLVIDSFNFEALKKCRPKTFAILGFIALSWILLSTYFTFKYVPKWRDAITLMSDCARREQSPKCIVQTAMREIHKGGCSPMADILSIGRARFASASKYATEFKTEMPFYDALCIGLSTSLDPQEKIRRLPYLFDQYNGAGEVMFSIILAELQAGRFEDAYRDVTSYFLSGSSGPMLTARNTVNIYRGAGQAICELYPQTDCAVRYRHFLNQNQKTLWDQGYVNWGKNLVKAMVKK